MAIAWDTAGLTTGPVMVPLLSRSGRRAANGSGVAPVALGVDEVGASRVFGETLRG